MVIFHFPTFKTVFGPSSRAMNLSEISGEDSHKVVPHS